jgi:hypothetical protein
MPLLRLDIGDVVAEGDVKLALDLVGDHRLAAGGRGEVHVQSLSLEQATVERDEEARRIQRGNHGHVQVRFLQSRRRRRGECEFADADERHPARSRPLAAAPVRMGS